MLQRLAAPGGLFIRPDGTLPVRRTNAMVTRKEPAKEQMDSCPHCVHQYTMFTKFKFAPECKRQSGILALKINVTSCPYARQTPHFWFSILGQKVRDKDGWMRYVCCWAWDKISFSSLGLTSSGRVPATKQPSQLLGGFDLRGGGLLGGGGAAPVQGFDDMPWCKAEWNSPTNRPSRPAPPRPAPPRPAPPRPAPPHPAPPRPAPPRSLSSAEGDRKRPSRGRLKLTTRSTKQPSECPTDGEGTPLRRAEEHKKSSLFFCW